MCAPRRRDELLRSTLARFAVPNALPSSAYVEPSSPKRPDLQVFCSATAFSTDVSVVHHYAQSNVSCKFAISVRLFHLAQNESTINTQQQQQPRVTPSGLLLSPREASSTRTRLVTATNGGCILQQNPSIKHAYFNSFDLRFKYAAVG